MRKRRLLFLILTLLSLRLSAQFFSDEAGSTYALVVGISDYEHDSIPDLKYAHKDAEIFVNFLRSNAGGAIPEDHLYFFTNETATSAAIYEALDQIKTKAVENDKVIIYFSGHGDKETDEYDELGYLLAYNTPYNNYRNNAIRIEDLNLDARTLTLKKGAEVIFFIDACHSGALSGVVNLGPALSARELEQLSGKEVRFMSCESKQKSLELSNLEGGRGLFSYFLVKGLLGAAERNDDLIVSMEELKSYVRDSVKTMAGLRRHRQTPVVIGDDEEYSMALLDENVLARIRSATMSTLAALGLEAEATTAAADVAASFAEEPAEEFTEARTRSIGGSQDFLDFQSLVNNAQLIAPEGQPSSYQFYQEQQTKNTDKKELEKMRSMLVVALQDEAQRAINAYLDGDYEELNRRLYVRYADSYTQYPEYLSLAAELVGPDYATYKAIKTKQHYFEGINYRLRHLMDNEFSKTEMKIAMDLQLKALELDEKAGYVHNELGVLHNLNGDRDAAMKAFEKANSIAPTWVIPMTNIANSYLASEQPELALTWASRATAQRQNYAPANMLLGYLAERDQNRLYAEMYYRRALLDNWANFRPFEALAKHYTLVGQYALADHLYKEAAFRKRGLQPVILSEFTFNAGSFSQVLNPPIAVDEDEMLARIRANRDDYEAWYYLGYLYTEEKRFPEAEASLLQVYRIRADFCSLYDTFGYLYTAWKRYDDAIDWLKAGMDLSASCNPVSYAKQLYPLYEQLERNEEAETLIQTYFPTELWDFYNRMITRYSENPDYWYKRGLLVYEKNRNTNIYANSGDTENYMVQWDELLPKDENGLTATVSMERTFSLPTQENWDIYWGNPVIEDFEQALVLAPEFPSRWDVHLKLAALYRTRGELFLDKVFDENRMLVQGVVSNSALQNEHYQSFVEETQKAIKNAERALEVYDDQAAARYRLIDLYQTIFEPEPALELLYELRDSNWINPHYRRQLARAQMLRGQLDSAFYSLSSALDQNVGPGRKDHELASLIYQLQGDFEKALQQQQLAEAHYDQVSGTPPNTADSYYRKAVLHALDGKEKQARKALEVAFKNGFDYRHVLQNDPALADLRSSDKYQNLIQQYNLDSSFIFDESLNQ